MNKYLVSVEVRYVVSAKDEYTAKALAIAAVGLCGVKNNLVEESVDCRGTDIVCITEEK